MLMYFSSFFSFPERPKMDSSDDDNIPLAKLKENLEPQPSCSNNESHYFTDESELHSSESEYSPEKCEVERCKIAAYDECDICRMILCVNHQRGSCQNNHRIIKKKTSKENTDQQDIQELLEEMVNKTVNSLQNRKETCEEATDFDYYNISQPQEIPNMHELIDQYGFNCEFSDAIKAEWEYSGTYWRYFGSETKRRSRKRLRNPNSWMKNKRKIKKNLGQEHVNSKGKLVEKKRVKDGCSMEKCKLKCHININPESRENILKDYWKMGDINLQRQFITRTVEKRETKRSLTAGTSRRKNTFIYSLLVNDTKFHVCKKFYVDTLDITQDIVFGSFQKQDVYGTVQSDHRGGSRPDNRRTVTVAAETYIREHINLFPHVPSHYCRATSKLKYLSPELSISKMYNLYTQKCSNESPPIMPEKKEVYTNIFHSLNLAFHQPKKDQCDVCVAYKNTPNPTGKQAEEHQIHLDMKKRARDYKNEIKQMAKDDKDKKITAGCFDLQQVLQCPNGKASDFYYKRKLGVYNCSVYDLTTAEGFCYMWPEHLAGRGSNEIASCVLDYIKKKSEEGYKIVFLFSDNCPGQNRNRYIPTMLWYALNKFSMDKIEHSFLEMGHTQNENDSVHSIITNAAKNIELYTPEQWYQTVRMSRKKPAPYIVKEMALSSMFDFKGVASKLKNLKVDDNNDKVKWNKIKSITIKREDPNALHIRYEHGGSQVRCDLMRRKRKRTNQSTGDDQVDFEPSTIATYRGISKKKKEDLMKLCADKLIPETYHAYFESIPVGPHSDDVVEDDGFEEDDSE